LLFAEKSNPLAFAAVIEDVPLAVAPPTAGDPQPGNLSMPGGIGRGCPSPVLP
jgi:hypothetical protein